MPRSTTTFLSALGLVLLASGCGGADGSSAGPAAPAADAGSAGGGELTARLLDAGGAEVGTVTLAEVDAGTRVTVEADGLPPGFHAFHIHAVGLCEPGSASPTDPSTTGDFLSAGGHLGAGESDHGQHAGDLPSLFIGRDGTGELTTVTDGLSAADLTDEDGSAVMVHAGRDNFANVPERYAPGGPDEATRGTGDAGGRIACGTVEG